MTTASSTADRVIESRHPREVPHIFSECQTCRGTIVAQTSVFRFWFTGGWVHLHGFDWQDDPHHAVPTDTGRNNLAEARRG